MDSCSTSHVPATSPAPAVDALAAHGATCALGASAGQRPTNAVSTSQTADDGAGEDSTGRRPAEHCRPSDDRAHAKPASPRKQLATRREVAMEVLTTERAFVGHLGDFLAACVGRSQRAPRLCRRAQQRVVIVERFGAQGGSATILCVRGAWVLRRCVVEGPCGRAVCFAGTLIRCSTAATPCGGNSRACRRSR